MTVKRLFLVVGVTGLLASAAFLAREAEGPGLRMVDAADRLLGSLEAKQKDKAAFAFEDEERTRWFFTPQQKARKPLRKGLPLAEMTDKQRELARELLRSGTSEAGYKKATMVMSLESILAELEKKGGIVRDPTWYFFSFFGSPSKSGKWGWRVEGHHLSLNFTLDGGKVVAATPFMFGANPAEVKAGKQKGQVTLPESMQPFRDVLASLDDEQRKAAMQAKPFPEIEEAKSRPNVGKPVGLAAGKMTEKQKGLLWKLIEGYAARMPGDVGAYELAAIKKAGFDDVHFAYGGGDGTPGKPYTYRVQGPTFVIEFLNEQKDSAGNPANHIHSAWRNMKGDFGLAAP
jgi:hypothetical protein